MKDRFILHQLDSIKQAIEDIEFRYDLIADEDQHLIESLKEENKRLNDDVFELGALNEYLEEENERLYEVINDEEVDKMKFEVIGTKVDKRFYRLVSNLMSEAVDEFVIEDAFYDFTDHNNVLNHRHFIEYAVSYILFNRLEYNEPRSLAQNEVLLMVLSELTRLYKNSLSKDDSMLKDLISYAPDIAETVYNEVYRH